MIPLQGKSPAFVSPNPKLGDQLYSHEQVFFGEFGDFHELRVQIHSLLDDLNRTIPEIGDVLTSLRRCEELLNRTLVQHPDGLWREPDK